MTEWKPGDVAMVMCSDGVERLAMADQINGLVDVWRFTHGAFRRVSISEARRLAVIDPEDRKQVERFRDLLPTDWCLSGDPLDPMTADESADQIAAAFRKFANPKPAKPAEPLGLGAVVEDAAGFRWVRLSDDNWRTGIGIAAITSNSWDRINAVRVLSEGVTE